MEFGIALSANKQLETLSMRNNKIKESEHIGFWDGMRENTTLRKLDMYRTGANDDVIDSMDGYFSNTFSKLREINLCHNGITDHGAKTFFEAIK